MDSNIDLKSVLSRRAGETAFESAKRQLELAYQHTKISDDVKEELKYPKRVLQAFNRAMPSGLTKAESDFILKSMWKKLLLWRFG